jgi:hypothetical protein
MNHTGVQSTGWTRHAAAKRCSGVIVLGIVMVIGHLSSTHSLAFDVIVQCDQTARLTDRVERHAEAV